MRTNFVIRRVLHERRTRDHTRKYDMDTVAHVITMPDELLRFGNEITIGADRYMIIGIAMPDITGPIDGPIPRKGTDNADH